MRILILAIALMTSCGTEDIDNTEYSPDQSALETEEPDVLTIMMLEKPSIPSSRFRTTDPLCVGSRHGKHQGNR
jgi:hypothetical protein